MRVPPRLAPRDRPRASTACACSSFARTLSPYSSARAGNVARCDSAASWKNSGHVSSGGSGIVASTTRAPSRSSRSTYCSAASVLRLAPAADRRRPRQQPDRQARERAAAGTRRTGKHRPHRARRRRRVVAIGPTVSKLGQSGKTPSIGIRPQLGFRPTRPQHAAGSRIEQPVSVPRPMSQSPAASAAALPPDEPPVVRPGMRADSARCRTTGSGSSRPTRTRAGSPCRRRPRRRRRAAAPRARCASGTWSA